MSEKFKKYEKAYLKCVKKCMKLSRSRRKKSCKSLNPKTILNKIAKKYNIDKNNLYSLPKITLDASFHYYDTNTNEFYSYSELDKSLSKSTDKNLESIYKIDIKNIQKNHK